MSVEAMAIALHHSRAKGAAKLVLIGIANHDGDGGAWPSMATLAKYGGVTADQARKLVRKLEELREVTTALQGGGTMDTPDHMRPNRYTFLLRCPADCDGSTAHRTRNVLFQGLSTPPAAPLGGTSHTTRSSTPTPYVNRRAEPSYPSPPVNKTPHVSNRVRAEQHHDHRGKVCRGELVDSRHCIFGCTLSPTGE